MYVSENPVYADRVEYDGERNPDEVICEIKWSIADLLDMMAYQGIELTDENIDAILKNRFSKTLRDRSIEEGWEIIEVLVSNSF